MAKKVFKIGAAVGLVVVVTLTLQTFFTVDEREQVVVTQFGQYIRTINKPGLAMKVPFIQAVARFDRRVLATDAPQAEYLSQDKKRLVADPVTRWRIADPLKFYKTVRDEAGARARLDDLVFSELRREVASHTFASVIGTQREGIMNAVAASTRERASEFGIEVIDVRIKRADLPREVQASVFARMQAEREREAKRYRSEGEEEAAKLRAETDKQRTIILADAVLLYCYSRSVHPFRHRHMFDWRMHGGWTRTLAAGFILRRRLSPARSNQLLTGAIKMARKLESFVRPRLGFLHAGRTMPGLIGQASSSPVWD
jgi:modulator of FtsH protease HflC